MTRGCPGANSQRSRDVDRERIAPSPPTQTGQAVLPHPAFQFVAPDGLAQALDSGLLEESHQPRRLAPRSPVSQAVHCQVGVVLQARCSGASGRTALRHYPDPSGMEFPRLPTPRPCPPGLHLSAGRHRQAVVTRFPATTRTLTPTGPFATSRGSLIHVTWISQHSVSNHQRFSTRRAPLPRRWPLYFVRASPFARRLAKTADRIEFTLPPTGGPCYGRFVHLQLLPTRGYRPGAVTFGYWPSSVGQVRDFHPAIQVRSQAHGRGSDEPVCRWGEALTSRLDGST
jgi:hypothetical protein